MRAFILLSLLSLSRAALSQSAPLPATESSALVSTYDMPEAIGGAAQKPTTEAPHHDYFNGDMFLGPRELGGNKAPVGSFTAGYIFTFTDSQTGHNRSLMGWSAVPEVTLYKTIGLQTEFSGLYVRSVYPGENRFLAAAGPRYTFAPRSRFTPFVYAEAGEMRSTSQATRDSDWNPVVKGGFGFEHKIAGGIAFQLIPGEYVGEQLDDHSWEHSFSARAGITFNLYR